MRALRVSHSGVVEAWRARERALSALGHDVHLLTAAAWNEFGAEVPLVPRPDEHVTGVRTLGRHPALFLYDPRPLWRALGESWDVIDMHEEPFALSTAEVLVLRALRRQRAPYTLYSAQNLDKRFPPPFRWFERWALRHASGVSVCNSEAGAIVERKGFPGRAAVIPLGLDAQHFAASPDVAPVEHADLTVGYVGRLEGHKGVHVLLEAVAGDERLRLRIAGAGPQRESLERQARAGAAAGRVEFVGPVDQSELPDFYRSLDVLAVPSLTTASWVEQYGRVAVEAMACGIPVVASDSGALPDVVSDAGVLVPPGDVEALREALLALAADPQQRMALREKGLARAAETRWERVAAAYDSMYRLSAHEASPHGSRDLDVVIVAYGAPELLAAAIEPVASLPVTVVDNSSSPSVRAVAERFGAAYVDPGRNAGFAAGVNEGLRRRRHPHGDVLLLNPDAVVSLESVAELRSALASDPVLASVGPAQTTPTGEPTRVTWPFPTPARTWLEAIGLSRLNDAPDFVIGSVLLLRGEALDHVGDFDERYFLYAEETDWARRARDLGWRHAEVPSATAVHVGAATSTDPEVREARFHASLERYLRKHHGTLGWWTARAGQVAGSAVRSVLLTGEGRSLARRRLGLYVVGPTTRASVSGAIPRREAARA